MSMSSQKLNKVAALAAQYINTTSRHVFLTGKAGTGKTTFLRHIVRNTFKNAVVAAPTGIAAINAGGVTLHSLLQLPFGAFVPENISLPENLSIRLSTPSSLGRGNRFRTEKRILINQMELLIIDEVSMLRADLLDCIDMQLRSLRRKPELPFGGVQILFIGDLMQLPPVVKDAEWTFLQKYYKSPFFFEARVLRQDPPLTVELTKIYRQNDQDFIDLLNRLRNNQQSQADLQWLNTFYKEDFDPGGFIHLTTHNYKADRINEEELRKLPGKVYSYQAEIEGDFPTNLFPIPEKMLLKQGAQVMFIKNDPSGNGQFFNGKIGQVSELGKHSLKVEFEDGTEVDVEKYTWYNIRYEINKESNQVEENELGSFTHYPLKLAWAVTVHKSQGLTFEKAIIDVADSFAPGQLYVALSRLTSMDGLLLSSPIPSNPPSISNSLMEFVSEFEEYDSLKDKVQEEQRAFLKRFARRAFDFKGLRLALENHLKTFNKNENRSLKQSYQGATSEIFQEVEKLQPIGHAFIRQLYKMMDEGKSQDQLAIRCIKSQDYFEPILLGLLRKIQETLGKISGKRGLKAYREELETLEEDFIEKIRLIARFCILVRETACDKIPTLGMLKAWELKTRLKERPKVKKVLTAEQSLRMFEEGLSIEEIAEQRELTTGTIFTHLISWVEKGTIGLDRLVEKNKIAQILRASRAHPGQKLTVLKSILGEEVSFEEIRAVLAYEKAKAAKEKAASEVKQEG